MLPTSASAPEIDLLSAQFRTLGVNKDTGKDSRSRVFHVPEPQIAPEGASVESRLLTILDTFKKQFTQELNQVFQFVHQRLAPINAIHDEHAKLKLQVTELNKKMKTALEGAIGLYDHIPFISNPKSQVDALYCMLNIEFISEYCFFRAKDLDAILGDTSRNASLAYFKKTVKECEALALLTIEEKVTQLDTLVTRVMRECDGTHTHSVYEVHDAMYLFMQYIVKSFRKELPEPNINLHVQLNCLESRLKAKLGNLYIDLDAKEPQKEKQDSCEKVLVVNSKNIVLPTENTFRNAPWKRYVTLLPYVGRYNNISIQIANLEGIAKALLCKENGFFDIYKRDQNGLVDQISLLQSLEEDRKICAGLQLLIESEIRSLAQLPLANEIHAGWNYAASLLAQVKVLQEAIERIRNNRFLKDMVGAVNLLKDCIVEDCLLEPATSGLDVQYLRCKRIWHAASSMQQISPIKVIDSGLGQIAFGMLKFTEAEKQVPKLVLSANYDLGDEQSNSWAITYLMKGFLRYVYFPPVTGRKIDEEFDKTLKLVNSDPAYARTFQAWLNSSEITTLFQAYLRCTKAV